MSRILLSILIPSIPTRMHKLTTLLRELRAQLEHEATLRGGTTTADDLPVEILVFTDNKKRTVGEKRNSLLHLARGEFVAFIDDDDRPEPEYIHEILNAIEQHDDVDVIVFNQRCIHETKENGRLEGIVKFGLEYAIDTQIDWSKDPIACRYPWHVMAWRRNLAQYCRFGEQNYGEDAVWVESMSYQEYRLCDGFAQHRIDKTLLTYHFNEDVTETQQCTHA